MPYSEPGSLRAPGTENYVSQALAFNTSRQPNTSRATFVAATVRIDLNADNEEGVCTFQVSPDNAAWTTVQSCRMEGEASGAFGAVANSITDFPMSAIVPVGYYYRVTTTVINGTPTFTYVSNTELQL